MFIPDAATFNSRASALVHWPIADSGIGPVNCKITMLVPSHRLYFTPLELGTAGMKLSTRYGAAGIVALAVLSAVHWLRRIEFSHGEVSSYLLGVLPNLCAAIAITFVVLSIWADQQKLIEYSAARRWFLIAAAIAGVGLLSWEVFQLTSDRFVFDTNDFGATLVGLLVAAAIFHFVTPRSTERPPP